MVRKRKGITRADVLGLLLLGICFVLANPWVSLFDRQPTCACGKKCHCLDGCKCGVPHKYVGAVDAGIQCLSCWEVKSHPLHTK